VIKPFTIAHLDEQLKLDVGKAGVTVSPIIEMGISEKTRFWKQMAQEEEFLGFMAYYENEPVSFINMLRASLLPYIFPELRRGDDFHVENKCLYVPPPYVERYPKKIEGNIRCIALSSGQVFGGKKASLE